LMSSPTGVQVVSHVVAIGHHAVRVVVEGELDLASSPQLEQLLGREISAGNDVQLDLSRVEFMDCQGLRAILWAASESRCNGRRLTRTSRSSAQVRRLIEIAGAADALPVVLDEGE
jgi:anti-sigma B factor antagonist